MKKHKWLVISIAVVLALFAVNCAFGDSGDEVRYKVSVTPVIGIAAGTNYDAQMVIDSEVGGILGNSKDLVMAHDDDDFWYNDSVWVSTSEDTIFTTDSVLVTTTTNGATVASKFYVEFLYIKNHGTATVYLTVDGTTPENVDISIKSGGSIVLEGTEIDPDDVYVKSSSGTQRLEVFAILTKGEGA